MSEVGHRIAGRTQSAIDRSDERLDQRLSVLASVGPAALAQATDRIDAVAARLLDRSSLSVERENSRLELLAARVAAVDPAVQLARGWTITRTDDGRIVRSIDDAAPGDTLTTALIDGEITSVIDAVHPNSHDESDTSDV